MFYRILLFASIALLSACGEKKVAETTENQKQPNVLLFITDDQSWEHIRALGCTFVNTPAMDKIAKEGVNFTNAFVAAPQCGPSRAALLTGKYCWQLESTGVHSSVSQAKFTSLPEVLEENGYHCGYTGKGAMPEWWTFGNRHQSLAGPEYASERLTEHYHWFYGTDYFRNFKVFMSGRQKNEPFFFFMSPFEPHRDFRAGGGQLTGKKLKDAQVPAFLPDVMDIRDDLLDYGSRIDYADKHLYQAMDYLDKAGELENTIIIISSDNGMAFPGAKATCYEYGNHVPLAIWFGDKIKGKRQVDAVVSLVDLFPTILDFADIDWQPEGGFSGISLKDVVESENASTGRDAVYFSRERHASARWLNLGYPQRAIRTSDYLYVYNFHPERWPAGSPYFIKEQGDTIKNGEILNERFYREYKYLPENPYVPEEAKKQIFFKWYNTLVNTYGDIDHSPSKTYMIRHRNDENVKDLFAHAFGKQPREMLFDIKKDPACLNNLAQDSDFNAVKEELHNRLFQYLEETKDARVVGNNPDIYESYRSVTKTLPPIPKPEWAIENPGLANKYEKIMTSPVFNEEYINLGGELINDTLFYHHWALTMKDKSIGWKKTNNLILYNLKKDPEMKQDVADKKYYGLTRLKQLAVYYQSLKHNE